MSEHVDSWSESGTGLGTLLGDLPLRDLFSNGGVGRVFLLGLFLRRPFGGAGRWLSHEGGMSALGRGRGGGGEELVDWMWMSISSTLEESEAMVGP